MATKNKTIVRAIKYAARMSALLAPGLAARWLERLFLTPSRHPPRPHERSRLAQAERTEVAFDASRRMPVHIWGTGSTVLLVHGWSGRGALYTVISAEAGIHNNRPSWIPAFAGMTWWDGMLENLTPSTASRFHWNRLLQ